MWPRCCQLDIPLKDLEWKEGNARSLNSLVVTEKVNISKVLVDLSVGIWGDGIFLRAWISSVAAVWLPREQGCGWALLLAALILGDVALKTDSQGFPKTVSYLMPSNKLFLFFLRVDSIVCNMNLDFSPTRISLWGHTLNFIYFQNHLPTWD